jgi:hypothetical protein
MISHTLNYRQRDSNRVTLDYRTEIKEGFELEPMGYYGPLEIVETFSGEKYWGVPSHSSIGYYPISDEMFNMLKRHFKSLEWDKVTYGEE